MYNAGFSSHVSAVDALARHGIAPPSDWAALRARFTDYSGIERPNVTRLAVEIVDPTGADVATLRALAAAEQSVTHVDIGAVDDVVRTSVHARLVQLYRPVAGRSYKTLAGQFDTAAKQFAAAAGVVDPELSSDAIVRQNERVRSAWLAAAVHAQQLGELLPILAAAAQLAGAPAEVTSLSVDESSVLLLPLACDPGKAHRRRVWESWNRNEGTCGRWSALHKLGVTIRAHRDPEKLTEYRHPLPLQGRLVPGPRGGHEQQILDPEDGPGADLLAAEWSA